MTALSRLTALLTVLAGRGLLGWLAIVLILNMIAFPLVVLMLALRAAANI